MDLEVQRCSSARCCCQSSWCCSAEEAESHSGGQEHGQVKNTGHVSSPETSMHWSLFADGRSMAQMDIHALGYKKDLFSHHILQRLGVFTRVTLATAFRQNVNELAQYRAAVPFHMCSQREGRKKKNNRSLCPKREWNGAQAANSAHVAKKSFLNSALA